MIPQLNILPKAALFEYRGIDGITVRGQEVIHSLTPRELTQQVEYILVQAFH